MNDKGSRHRKPGRPVIGGSPRPVGKHADTGRRADGTPAPRKRPRVTEAAIDYEERNVL
jgi:hypothetical protein